MTQLADWLTTPRALLSFTVAAAAFVAGCSGDGEPNATGAGGNNPGAGGSASNPTGGTGAGNASGGSVPGGGSAGTGQSAGGSAGVGPDACTGNPVAVPKRIVRLSFNQIANSLVSLVGAAKATELATTYEIGDAQHRWFPPLSNPREGSSLTQTNWKSSDQIASDVGKYIADNRATTTTCGATPTADCVKTFVLGFAERAYRRPLTDVEKTSLGQVLTDLTATGGTTAQVLEFGVYSVMQAPQFLYRTELGEDSKVAGTLKPYEFANQLSYFLTDGPPDDMLLAAASQNQLGTPELVTAQVQRLLQTTPAKRNLEDAMFAYFGLYDLESVIVDSADFNSQIRNSMYHESELFLSKTLWGGPLNGLLTSRSSMINATLAPLYGVTNLPTTGLDADGFVAVDLPENRAGMLTQAGFLTARSRPDQPSVVGRGLLINGAILCATNPSFPTQLAEQIGAISAMEVDLTERQKSDNRGKTSPCNGCHLGFDAYGLALGNFDTIGRYVTADGKGRPIDASVTLPALAGGAVVKSATEMAQALASNGSFGVCMARNVMNFALAETPAAPESAASVKTNGCATRTIADSFAKTPQTFSDLITQVAISTTLGQRSAGQGVAQ